MGQFLNLGKGFMFLRRRESKGMGLNRCNKWFVMINGVVNSFNKTHFGLLAIKIIMILIKKYDDSIFFLI